MYKKTGFVAILLLLIAIGIVGYNSLSAQPGLANPASEHCVEQGGSVDIREDADGGQVGYCQFDSPETQRLYYMVSHLNTADTAVEGSVMRLVEAELVVE